MMSSTRWLPYVENRCGTENSGTQHSLDPTDGTGQRTHWIHEIEVRDQTWPQAIGRKSTHPGNQNY